MAIHPNTKLLGILAIYVMKWLKLSLIILVIGIFCVSIASAGFFGNLLESITGKATKVEKVTKVDMGIEKGKAFTGKEAEKSGIVSQERGEKKALFKRIIGIFGIGEAEETEEMEQTEPEIPEIDVETDLSNVICGYPFVLQYGKEKTVSIKTNEESRESPEELTISFSPHENFDETREIYVTVDDKTRILSPKKSVRAGGFIITLVAVKSAAGISIGEVETEPELSAVFVINCCGPFLIEDGTTEETGGEITTDNDITTGEGTEGASDLTAVLK
ncbi:hypothetical protein HZB88_02460 [archaeon]|nr:hypothetical protein [archaeon]